MMSVTAIIQGAQAQHWGRSLAGLGPPHVPLGKELEVRVMSKMSSEINTFISSLPC